MSSWLKFAIELQAVYLLGTTYLRTPLFGIIPVVTLFSYVRGLWLASTRVRRRALAMLTPSRRPLAVRKSYFET